MLFCPAESKFMWFWKFVIPFIRFWGILTATVLCGVGTDVLMHYRLKGIYILLASFVVLLLEITWILSHFRRLCVIKDSRRTGVWHIPNIKHWQRGVFYLPLSIAVALTSYRLWLSSIASAMLVILACLHFLVCFRDKKKIAVKRTLLLNEEDYQERHEEVIFEVLDNSIRSKDEMTADEPDGHTLNI